MLNRCILFYFILIFICNMFVTSVYVVNSSVDKKLIKKCRILWFFGGREGCWLRLCLRKIVICFYDNAEKNLCIKSKVPNVIAGDVTQSVSSECRIRRKIITGFYVSNFPKERSVSSVITSRDESTSSLRNMHSQPIARGGHWKWKLILVYISKCLSVW